MPLPLLREYGAYIGAAARLARPRISHFSPRKRGGYGVKPIRKPIDGVCLVPEFQDLFDCLAIWRTAKDGKPAV